MENIDLLDRISTQAIQKRLPFAISLSEISNYIGNFSLAPNSVPITNRSKYIMQAIAKELLLFRKSAVTEEIFTIPDEIQSICANNAESTLIILDSILLPDLCVIQDKNKNRVATIIQIHPTKGELLGTCTLDFGLSEKQTIYIKSQTLIRIPIATTHTMTIQMQIINGTSSNPMNTPIEIGATQLGLIIDTREVDILIKSEINRAKQLSSEWLQSFDIPVNDI